jgi:hypothetical protein
MMATSRTFLDARIKSLALDIEAVEQIRGKMPVLDWGDQDVVLVHSAANMLQNELNVLQRNRRCAREGAGPSMATSISSRVKATLRSAGHRALRSVTLVFDRECGCQSPRLVPASSSPSVRGAAYEPADDGSGHRLQRKVRFACSSDSDDLVMSEGGSVDRGDRAVAVIAGNRILPLSGTF